MIITESSRGFEVQFDYRPAIVAELKQMGARFQGKERGWFVALVAKRKLPDGSTEEVYNRPAMDRFKKKYISVHPDAIGAEQIFKIEDLPELTVEIPWRPGAYKPYHYQTTGIARGLQFERFVNADEPGLGKTGQAIGTILGFSVTERPPFPCLVICPATLKDNWRREIEETWSTKRAIILSDKNRHTWHQYIKMGMADFVICNFESLWSYFVIGTTNKKGTKPRLAEINFNPLINNFKAVIIDEIHRLKDGQALQTKAAKGICIGKKYVIGLTGTPLVNKPMDLASQLSIINRLLDLGGAKYFKDRYCQGGSGSSNLSELNGKMSNVCFFRREKKDVLTDLPEKTRVVITCDITTQNEYDKAKRDLGSFLKESGYSDKQIKKSMNAEIMVKIGVLKGISARGKLPEAYEQIDEIVEAGEKVVVFIHQKFMAEALLSKYPDAVSIRGDDDIKSRQNSVDRFQNDPNVKVIICSIKAAGVGITLTAASRLIFLELPWHPADVEQCEARIERIGQKNAMQILYLLGKNTIDEDIYKLIETKREMSDQVTGSTTTTETLITDITRSLFNQR